MKLAEKLRQMEPFIQIEYIREKMPDTGHRPEERVAPGTYWVWPYATAQRTELIPVEHKRIPLGELAIKRGAPVEAINGHVGRVDEFLVDSTSEHITHLVMREGHLWGKKDVVIPIKSIDHFYEDTVYLKLSKAEVEKLPTVPIRRGILA